LAVRRSSSAVSRWPFNRSPNNPYLCPVAFLIVVEAGANGFGSNPILDFLFSARLRSAGSQRVTIQQLALRELRFDLDGSFPLAISGVLENRHAKKNFLFSIAYIFKENYMSTNMETKTDQQFHLKVYGPEDPPSQEAKTAIIDFLFEHLDQYGDARKDITRAVNYALKVIDSFGGQIVEMKDGDKVIGAVILNRTGMGGYIPENILVYIAAHGDYRGRGLGKKLMRKAIEATEGDIALHVEANNPAKFLYEKMGFTNPYLEMRLKKKS
jgi:ribosomal protein S18 acetylase RimI-like enzyme